MSVDELDQRVAGNGAAHNNGRPVIQGNDRQLAALADEATEILDRSNDPPVVFVFGGLLTRAAYDEERGHHLAPYSRAALRDRLSRVASFVRLDDRGKIRNAYPDTAMTDVIMSRIGEWPFPPVERIVRAPVFAADGTLCDRDGYNRAGRVIYIRDGLEVPEVPERPTDADVAHARALFLDELLHDFPFVSEADRAHALALALAPFVRSLIAGPTPLHLVEASGPGTGKGLMTDVLLDPFMGPELARIAEGRDEDEWRKRLTSLLLQGKPIALIDNLRMPLDAGALAAALTTTVWEDRVLGRSEMVGARVRCVWVATGNNPTLSTEMIRRSLRIRLDAHVERPWLRTGWRHPALRRWAEDHRGELVWAALVLVRAWLAEGRPPPSSSATLGMFEDWAVTVGGILEVAGVAGFLENLAEFYAAADGELAAMAAFVASWAARHGSGDVTVSDLWQLAHDSDLDLGEGSDRSRRIVLGRLVGGYRDRVVADWRIVKAGEHKRAALWRLERRGECR